MECTLYPIEEATLLVGIIELTSDLAFVIRVGAGVDPLILSSCAMISVVEGKERDLSTSSSSASASAMSKRDLNSCIEMGLCLALIIVFMVV
ncbi:hypothetical protein RchiOBHm_Chr7g0186651 [Rosa chinensis]|uniref:Uncharacterized protein n=1 Tax=Rosa chinensis TaxID=74649 RepID=A0A2P6P3Z6_ROSCH|nr:hypothetical protein RchiOBHm_Chr7g0186651 [Rosa chinensis]